MTGLGCILIPFSFALERADSIESATRVETMRVQKRASHVQFTVTPRDFVKRSIHSLSHHHSKHAQQLSNISF